MIETYDIIESNSIPMLLEVREKIKEGFISESLDHSLLLVSSEIKEKLESDVLFDKILTVALSEISNYLDKEIGKMGYIIEVSIVEDYEYPDWRDNVITIKVPIKDDPKYIIRLWSTTSDRVWEKIRSIKERAEEIDKISKNTRIAFDILG